MSHITDDMIETAAEKLLDGLPLTQRERRLLNSSQAHFAMGQVEAILSARKIEAASSDSDPRKSWLSDSGTAYQINPLIDDENGADI